MTISDHEHINNYHLIHLQFSIRVEKLDPDTLTGLKDIAAQIQKMFDTNKSPKLLVEQTKKCECGNPSHDHDEIHVCCDCGGYL